MKNLVVFKNISLTVHQVLKDAAIIYLIDNKLQQYVLDWNTQGILMDSLEEGMVLSCNVSIDGYVISVES